MRCKAPTARNATYHCGAMATRHIPSASTPSSATPDAPPVVGKGVARREQVLDAAAQCFRELGFHAASIQRISAAAGMSPGHIYHYFQNKEAIVGGIVQRDLEEVIGRVRAMQEVATQRGVVQACIESVDTGLAQRSEPAYAALGLEIMAEATRNPDVAAMVQQAYARARAEVRELLRQLPAMRKLPARELDARIAVMHTLFDGLLLRAQADPTLHHGAISKVIQRVMRMLLEDTDA